MPVSHDDEGASVLCPAVKRAQHEPDRRTEPSARSRPKSLASPANLSIEIYSERSAEWPSQDRAVNQSISGSLFRRATRATRLFGVGPRASPVRLICIVVQRSQLAIKFTPDTDESRLSALPFSRGESVEHLRRATDRPTDRECLQAVEKLSKASDKIVQLAPSILAI